MIRALSRLLGISRHSAVRQKAPLSPIELYEAGGRALSAMERCPDWPFWID
jgi:hypothetical protein